LPVPIAEVCLVLGLFFGIVEADIVCVVASDMMWGKSLRGSLNCLRGEEECRRLHGTSSPEELLRPFEIAAEAGPIPEVCREHVELVREKRKSMSADRDGLAMGPALRRRLIPSLSREEGGSGQVRTLTVVEEWDSL